MFQTMTVTRPTLTVVQSDWLCYDPPRHLAGQSHCGSPARWWGDSQKQNRLLDWKTDQLQLRQSRQAQPHLNPPLQYSTPFLHSTNNDDCAKESSSKTAHACNLSALQACRQFVKTRLWAACQVSLLTYFTTFVLKMNWSMNQNVKIFFCEQNIQNIPRHWMEVVLQKPSWRHRPPPPRLCWS